MTEAPQKTAEELGAALNLKHRRFVEKFFELGLSVTAAAKACDYKNPSEGSRICRRPEVAAYIQARLTEACMPADEVLARISAYARVTGDQFTETQEYEVPVYEKRPLNLKIAGLERQIAQFRGLGPEKFKSHIERLERSVLTLEADLIENPDATYDVQVGTQVKKRVVPSLEAAQENGVLFALESIEQTQHGLKWKRASSLDALTLVGKHHRLFVERQEVSGPNGGPIEVTDAKQRLAERLAALALRARAAEPDHGDE
ncbi:hypothetical protein DKM44_12895 [Deinococcus irradiatisoli]|uniref:Terminase small subunit n=1 Tax=Deinococcus irradiatisoli TaxID=2202254 RepID=A0A2Z3JRQ1_9DEIO|nr:terminase small subunit [Deinococcus irradiatisoli]AWN24018.1 hypothetical protein DKM44_12895 [Deinococcus irradiatisoli]